MVKSTKSGFPRWYKWVLCGVFFALAAAWFLVHDGSVQRSVASMLLDRVVNEQGSLLDYQAVLARGAVEPRSGSYYVNGMKVQYATHPAPIGPVQAVGRFKVAFDKVGYVSRILNIRGQLMLAGIHPETRVFVTVRPTRDSSGRGVVRLSQQNLSTIPVGYKATISGIPVIPGATKRIHVQADERGRIAESLNYTVASSPEWVADYYAAEMAREGWTRLEAPLDPQRAGLMVFFFQKGAEESALSLFPHPDQSETIVLVTKTSPVAES